MKQMNQLKSDEFCTLRDQWCEHDAMQSVIAQQPGLIINLEHDAILWVIAQHPGLVIKTGHDAILWIIVQHPGIIMEIGHDAIQWVICLWKQFLRSEQEQEKETVKTKKPPPLREGPN